jgi:DNA-binding NarL/FixJ family response regulator
VAQRPGAHSVVFAHPETLCDASPSRGARIVVIDDEDQADAVELVQRLKAQPGDASVVYLAARHTPALEGKVRRAGANFYTVKSARDGVLARVLEVLLAR